MSQHYLGEPLLNTVVSTISSDYFPQHAGRPQGALSVNPLYPQHAFPLIAYHMIAEMCRNIQTPLAVSLNAVLAAMSAATQSWVRIQVPNEDRPQIVSLIIFTGADSGTGKTKAANQAFRSFRAFSLHRLRQHVQDERPRKVQSALYRAKYNALRARLTKLYDPARNASAEEIADVERILSDHIENQMDDSKPRLYIKGDISMTKLLSDLHGTNVPALWTTDEGQTFFGKMTKEDMEVINQIWDGQTVVYDRVNNSALVEEPLVTIGASTQCHGFDRFMKNKGRFAIPGGLVPRSLMAKAADTALGLPIMDPTWHCSDAFNARIMALLEEHERLVKHGAFKPITLEFDEGAKQVFMELLDRNRHRMKLSNDWGQIQKSALKHPSNVARIAAIFHFFDEQPSHRISTDTLRRAITVADWYMEQARQILVIEPMKRRLKKLITFLHDSCFVATKHRSHVHEWEAHLIPIRWILQFHNVSKDALVPLLQALFDEDMAKPVISSWSGSQCIQLNPIKFFNLNSLNPPSF